MEQLLFSDINLILDSLNYSKLKVESSPIGENGYPSYEFKQKKLDEVNSVIQKVKNLKSKK